MSVDASMMTKMVEVNVAMQAVAALAELAIPHFTTRTIFSVANLGSKAKFYDNVQVLAVSAWLSAPEIFMYFSAQHKEDCLSHVRTPLA